MPTYMIKVKNESSSVQNYLLFQAPPEESTSLGKVWSNVWIKTGDVNTPHGQATCTITSDMFAITGRSQEQLADGVSIDATDYIGPVSLTAGPNEPGTKGTVYIKGSNPMFQGLPYGTTQKQNSFAIHVNSYEPKSTPNVVIGLGKYNADHEVVPALVFGPSPGNEYVITPNVTYYIATGSYTAGDVVDITAYGDAVAIDFTQAATGQTIATVTHNSDGSYSGPVFSAPGRA